MVSGMCTKRLCEADLETFLRSREGRLSGRLCCFTFLGIVLLEAKSVVGQSTMK